MISDIKITLLDLLYILCLLDDKFFGGENFSSYRLDHFVIFKVNLVDALIQALYNIRYKTSESLISDINLLLFIINVKTFKF